MSDYHHPMVAQIHHGRGFVEISNVNGLVASMPLTELELAKVMAAAPEMLDALQALVDECDKNESVHVPWRMARLAIKKATSKLT